jgi:hypothetical protein
MVHKMTIPLARFTQRENGVLMMNSIPTIIAAFAINCIKENLFTEDTRKIHKMSLSPLKKGSEFNGD